MTEEEKIEFDLTTKNSEEVPGKHHCSTFSKPKFLELPSTRITKRISTKLKYSDGISSILSLIK